MKTESALTAILVTPETQTTVAAEGADALASLAQIQVWPCETVLDEEDLGSFLELIQERLQALEEKRTAITGPLNAAKRAVDALFAPAKDALTEAKGIIKAKLAVAANRRREENHQRLLAAQAAAAAGQVKEAQEALARVEKTKAPQGASYRSVWEWELDDISQVPTEFLALNHATMKLYANKYQKSEEIPPVPGVRFVRSTQVASRRG